MAHHSRIPSARQISAIALAILAALCFQGASAAPAEQPGKAEHGRADNIPVRSADEPLTELEKMELHYRRYSAAANGMAQLFKQLNQKIEDVSLAAKAAEAKNSSHNRRVLEDKLRQLESARTSYSLQHAQLQGQMQNENRSYAAIVNNLKTRYSNADDSQAGQTDTKAKPPKGKDAKSRGSRSESRAGQSKGQDSKATGSQTAVSKVKERKRDTQGAETQGGEREAKDPRVMDLDTRELRERRDRTSDSGSAPGPTLNPVR